MNFEGEERIMGDLIHGFNILMFFKSAKRGEEPEESTRKGTKDEVSIWKTECQRGTISEYWVQKLFLYFFSHVNHFDCYSRF